MMKTHNITKVKYFRSFNNYPKHFLLSFENIFLMELHSKELEQKEKLSLKTSNGKNSTVCH